MYRIEISDRILNKNRRYQMARATCVRRSERLVTTIRPMMLSMTERLESTAKMYTAVANVVEVVDTAAANRTSFTLWWN